MFLSFISTAPNPPAPDQSRHNIEETGRLQQRDGKDIDKAGKGETTQKKRVNTACNNAEVVREKRKKRETSS